MTLQPAEPTNVVERRTARRAACHYLVRYQDPHRLRWRLTPLKDVSIRGARLMTDETLAVNDELELWFGLPLFEQPVRIAARVVWHRIIDAAGAIGAESGVRFTQLDPSTQAALGQTIARLAP